MSFVVYKTSLHLLKDIELVLFVYKKPEIDYKGEDTTLWLLKTWIATSHTFTSSLLRRYLSLFWQIPFRLEVNCKFVKTLKVKEKVLM